MNIERQSIHVWFVCDQQLSCPKLLRDYHSILNVDELAQYKRFHYDSHRHQYLVTRALVKSTLSRYYPQISPKQWRFNKSRYGKPAILNHVDTPLYFNISHTNGLVTLALTRENEIGVDIEWTQRHRNIAEVAKHYFSPPEIKALQEMAAPQRHIYFFELWTLKEAYIKACGQGMSIPLNQFHFQRSKQHIDIRYTQPTPLSNECYQFWQFQFAANYQGALAIKSKSNSDYHHSLHFKKVVPLTNVEESINIPHFPHSFA
uniref:4'-phosphopantetheinyl transferase family protein n=1 Tax=Pseudoalteromonas sp. (strain SANK 73390) TaxID=747457 RepID=UPI0002117265|nr:4'-phosphopantetheinyl transferase superfamily protein [Pseudoalteromonas sp. SANK 73390]CBK62709.1 tmlN [Pseudoalteromonas sp. SANK 73390]